MKNTSELASKKWNTYLQSLHTSDPNILAAFMRVPRERFVPVPEQDSAYEDIPLPIGAGQTISQPSLVAHMIELLELTGTESVLEVGTGSGFGSAVLSHLVKQVYTIERIQSLAIRARATLKELGISNVNVFWGDGSDGLIQYAPFDAIIVTACSPTIPSALKTQLGFGGRLIIPVGFGDDQRLVISKKEHGHFSRKEDIAVRFVPLVQTGLKNVSQERQYGVS